MTPPPVPLAAAAHEGCGLGAGAAGSPDRLAQLRASASLPQLRDAPPLAQQEQCRWELPAEFRVGEPFTVKLRLSPAVSVRRDDFIALYVEGGPDYDFGSRWYRVTADRLQDGFRWDGRAWDTTGAYSGEQRKPPPDTR